MPVKHSPDLVRDHGAGCQDGGGTVIAHFHGLRRHGDHPAGFPDDEASGCLIPGLQGQFKESVKAPGGQVRQIDRG